MFYSVEDIHETEKREREPTAKELAEIREFLEQTQVKARILAEPLDSRFEKSGKVRAVLDKLQMDAFWALEHPALRPE